jgi:outer membrane protein OmpA-like peptidoglycan-associated protein
MCLAATLLQAQAPQVPASVVTQRTIKAIAYQVNSGSTVDLKNTGLVAGAGGEARVEAKPAVTTVEAKVENLSSPTKIGSEFLTYVLWAVSNEGRAVNLGEILTDDNGRGKLKATTQLQSFSLFVTAEPYSAVRQPSEMLVLENEIRKNTKGRIFMVNNYQLLKRNQYEKLGNPLALSMDLKNVPLAMYEARNSVDIARARSADKYAPDVFGKAEAGLKMAENALTRKSNQKEIISLARTATQFSEDARALTAERKEEERIANERAAAAARAKAEAEAKAAAEAQRQAQLNAQKEAAMREEARRQAELAAAKEAQIKAEAAAKEAQIKAEAAAKEAQVKAQAEIAAAQAKAREDAAKAEADRALRASEELRAQLLAQFNRILETRDSTRGLVITMGDVLFDTGKYDLRSNAREILAKVSGIILAHPGLNLEVEGHTDSVGGDDFNQKLSEKRAEGVRDYLVAQGLPADTITARGFGKEIPVASNDTAAGRQKNRRVELIVAGEVIGVKIGR